MEPEPIKIEVIGINIIYLERSTSPMYSDREILTRIPNENILEYIPFLQKIGENSQE